MSKIELNASLEVTPRAAEPLRMTQEFATIEALNGEKIQVLTDYPVRTAVILRGEMRVGTIDLISLLRQAIPHVMRDSAE